MPTQTRTAGPEQVRRRWRPFLPGTAAAPADERLDDALHEGVNGVRRVERRERTYRRMLAYADLGSLVIALGVVVGLMGNDVLRPASLLALPLVVAISKIMGLYDRDELVVNKTTIDEAPQLFHLATLYTLLFWVSDDVLIQGQLGSQQALALWGALFLSAIVGRRAARALAARATPPERCLFVGDAVAYDRLRAKFLSGRTHAELVGRMSLARMGRAGGRTARETDLRELIQWTDVDRVMIEPGVLPPEDMLDFVRAAKSVGVRVSLLPRVLDVVGSSVVFDDLGGLTVLGVRRFRLTRSSLLVKRAFDLAGGCLMLLAVAPLMAIIAVLIKVTSPGPVLFRQTRVGRDGKHFRICKFRTMCSDAEQRKEELRAVNEVHGGLFKITDDPRVTSVGRLLRKTSLDELPQLFNVVGGDMSLVGPRPLVVDEDEQIKGWDRRRLHLTPGMTGPWQILGSARVPLPEMVKIDYLYVGGWSLWSDVKIMIRTVPYMLARRGM